MASLGHALALAPEIGRGLTNALASFGRKTRERGARYARGGRVESIALRDGAVEAVVRGSSSYSVVWEPLKPVEGAGWVGKCTCPVGIYCKHAFAVAVLLLGAEMATPVVDDEDDEDIDESFDDVVAPRGARFGSATRATKWHAAEPPAPKPSRDGADRNALRRLRNAQHSWDRHTAARAIVERAGIGYDQRHQIVAAADLDDSDPDVRCWRLAAALARVVGPDHLPAVLAPFLHRPDLEQRVLERERDGLRRELLTWMARGRATAQPRSLRALLRLDQSPNGEVTLAIEVRVTSPRGELVRSPSQLRQLRNEVRDDSRLLTSEQAELLALLVDQLSSAQSSSRLETSAIDLPLGALRSFLEHGVHAGLIQWHEEISADLARRGGIVPGSQIRLSADVAHVVPFCVSRDGEAVLELHFTWRGGRSAAFDEALYVVAGDSWRGDAAALVIADGAISAIASAPPQALVDRFRAARGLPLAPAERVPLLSRLAGRWPHLRETLAAHTNLVDVEPVVTLDLREDDWLQVRLVARRRAIADGVVDDSDREGGAGDAAHSHDDFEYVADESWQPVRVAESGNALVLPIAGSAVAASATESKTDTTPRSLAPDPADTWQEAPDPELVTLASDWLRATGAFPGERRGPGGVEPPWPDRATGFWLRLTSRRIASFFEEWQRRPPGVLYLGNERARRLLGPATRALPKLRIAASGVDFFAVSAAWETEAKALSAEDVAALRAATTRFVRLRSGWVRRPDGDEAPAAIESALADLGVEVGAGEQRLTLWQLAGARSESLDALEGVGADADTMRAVHELRERIASFKGLPRIALPRSLRAKLRPYQRDGLDFLAFAAELGTGAILADDMGLGKTVQALAWLEHLRKRDPGGGPALVVCPASVVHNWRREAERFVPSLRVLVLERGGARHALRAELDQHDLVITNYALLRRDAAAWHETELRAAILDEAQNVKNPDAAVTRAAHGLRAKHRLALTGTPLENRPLDVFSIASFVCPGYLGSRKRFSERFDSPELPPSRRVLLAARLRPLLLRRLKRDVARDLPERIEERRDCELTPGQRRLYLAEVAKSRALVARLENERDGLKKNRITILAALTRLRQICCHPALVGGKPELGSGKLEALLEILEPLTAEGHKVLVFSQFVGLLRLLEPELAARGIAHHVLTGATVDRESVLQRFAADPRPAVFLLSLKAGGTGLNLTAASYVVLFDPWWNPAVEAQAIDRSHRIGQDRSVIAYRLIARGTIEEKIALLQERKASMVRELLGDGGGAARALTREDLQYLLSADEAGGG